jgi:hypothetical protein
VVRPKKPAVTVLAVGSREQTHLTLSQLLERGWTRTMVRDLLGEEDQRRRNPFYRKAAPMRLWSLERVIAAESESAFAELQAAYARRRDAARAAARERARELRAWAQTVRIRVDRMPAGVAIARAIESYNDSNYLSGEEAGPWSDDAFLARITVNYLRHESTPYDRDMDKRRGQPGVREARSILRKRVLAAIGAAYPAFALECERQATADRFA